MTDSNRTSASTGLPTPVDDGTPAGHPTPAGEPSFPAESASPQIELFPDLRPCADAGFPNRELLAAIGGLILAWGQLERATTEKLAAMRESFGDVRTVGGRARPTMQRLLGELRALIAMRDRHDKQVLTVIAEMDGILQRTAQFRLLLVDGAQDVVEDGVSCRDLKNNPIIVSVEEIARETAQLRRICEQISVL